MSYTVYGTKDVPVALRLSTWTFSLDPLMNSDGTYKDTYTGCPFNSIAYSLSAGCYTFVGGTQDRLPD